MQDITTATNFLDTDPSDVPGIINGLGHIRAQVKIVLKAGDFTITEPWPTHPDGDHILIRGANVATPPVKTDFTGVKATDETMLKAKWDTIIRPDEALVRSDKLLGTIQDVLVIGGDFGIAGAPRVALRRVHCFDQTNAAYVAEYGGMIDGVDASCSHGHDGGRTDFDGTLRLNDYLAFDMSGYGLRVNHGGNIYPIAGTVIGRCQTGINATDAGAIRGHYAEIYDCTDGATATGGRLRLHGSDIHDCGDGLAVYSGGWAKIEDGYLTDCDRGLYVHKGFANIDGATFSGNTVDQQIEAAGAFVYS